jgi:precorrin-3B C17-methyltransferase
VLPGRVPVVFATAISRPEERIVLSDLATADPALADMRTLVLVGSAATRRIERTDGGAWLYTPRSAA